MSHPSSLWRVLLVLISLGTQPLGAAVVINEIHYRPVNKLERTEFIELYNAGTNLVAMSGWRLEGAVEFTFPNGSSLAPGAYMVVAQDPAALGARFSVTALGPWSGQLSNEGEEIRLVNAAGREEDRVDYQLGFPWPTVGDAPGYSIELIHPLLDNDLGGSWRASFTGAAQPGTTTLIPRGSEWQYFKGMGEPSSPSTAWRLRGFNDSAWLVGRMPIGYDPSIPMGVNLDDMLGRYTTVYFRKQFVIQDLNSIQSLNLSALFDDGFKLWFNGVAVRDGDFNLAPGDLAYTATSGPAREDSAYNDFTLISPRNFLVAGTNVLAIQAANVSRDSSSDFYMDIGLTARTGPPTSGPTPGTQNSVYSALAPPQIRQVEHSPEQPREGQEVRITAKITDPDGVGTVSLQYQQVLPGSYIALTDTQYTNGWTTLAMNDAGVSGDEQAGDDVFTALIPATVQAHRRLIRYRIIARDQQNNEVRVPYADDPVPNFAYFCYNGIPGWRGALNPGSTQPTDFSPAVMGRLPAIHLISRQSEVENATWFSLYQGDAYPWIGTLVYDGQVYDHIHFRARGGVWRYAMVKNMWKFDMNNGHYFQMRDDYGRKYKTKWTKLNLGASIQQGDYLHRGEQGMFESVGFKLFNLAGIESPNTTFVQFRVVDSAVEAPPNNQFEGDFWGVYLVIEQEDGRFLDQHDLPDGNLYKMEGGTGELNNLGRLGPADKSDLNTFLNTYRNSPSVSEAWWRTNFDAVRYANYQAIVQGIHHYDISDGKNYFYYRNPDTGLWSVHSWDLDLTWANNMYRDGGGQDDIFRPFLGGNGYSVKTNLLIAFKNRVREIQNLLFNPDQAGAVIDEYADLLRGPRGRLSILEADRFMWDYNPKMNSSTYSSSLSKAGQGRFYQWPYEPGVSKSFEGAVELMKNYVAQRGSFLATLAADPLIPTAPAITYTGASNYPVDKIRFTRQGGSGSGPLLIRWRIGEVSKSNAPSFNPAEPRKYEITPVWESADIPLSQFTEVAIPPAAMKAGHAYRARARLGDSTGRWSAWSAPVEFIATEADSATALEASLRLSELMPEPVGGTDYEFVELHNRGREDLNLEGVRFTSGIDYTFPAGAVLAPGEYGLVIKHTNSAAFKQFYGLSNSVQVFGPYSGSLANGGEEITLKSPGGASDLLSFEYGNGRGWPLAAQAGHSLVPLVFENQLAGALDYPGNWRASAYMRGSPGLADPAPPPAQVLLNEVMAHTDYMNPAKPEYDSNDWIELYNPFSAPVGLTNYFLTDDPSNLRKYALPAVSIAANGFLTLDEVSAFHSPVTSGFGLDKSGEQVILSYLPGGGEDRVVDEVRFKGQENDFSLGRYPDGAPWWFQALLSSNSPNRTPLSGLVIQELMYRPPGTTNDNTRDEYIEIYNPTSSRVSLSDTNGTWRLNGGVQFTFSSQAAIEPGAALLVVNFDPSIATNVNAFKAAYGITNNPALLGPYSGKLGNSSDRVAIERPQAPDIPGGAVSWVIVDEVIYGNQSPWPAPANGSGDALQRLSAAQHGSNPANWAAGQPSPGSVPGTSADSDGDGLPDAWERSHQLDPANPADAALDPDADGMDNLAEYRAGTDPRDPGSRLSLAALRQPSGVVTLKFTARANRSYTVQFRADLSNGLWQKLEDVPLAADERQVTIDDPSAGAFQTRFYRLVTPSVP